MWVNVNVCHKGEEQVKDGCEAWGKVRGKRSQSQGSEIVKTLNTQTKWR